MSNAAASPLSDLLIVGGRTRLAQALYAASSEAGLRAFVVYSSPAERAALLALYPDTALVGSAARPSPSPSVCIVICVFGLVHPAPPDIELHSGRLVREGRLLSELLAVSGDRIHVVLVSTVIALIPPRDRAYYAAFKNLAEAAVAAALRDGSRGRMSVVYPGRLVERRGVSRPVNALATPYVELARRLVHIAVSGRPVARVVGFDARLWIAVKVVQVLLCALLPSGRSMPVQSRDGLPRA